MSAVGNVPYPSASVCSQGIYVIDGTNSEPAQNNLMTHLYLWATARPAGCALIKRYYSGISRVRGLGTEQIVDQAVADICKDALHGAANPEAPPVESIALFGFSRGAIAAVTIANRLRRERCGNTPFPARIDFLGLVDPVRTSICNMDGTLDPGIPGSLQIIKEQRWSLNPVRVLVWTHVVGNMEETEVVKGIEHEQMNCLDKNPQSGYIESKIIQAAERRGFSFGPRVRKGECSGGPGSTQRLVEVVRSSGQ